MKMRRKDKKKIRRRQKRKPGIPGLGKFCQDYGCERSHAFRVLTGRRESWILKRQFKAWKKDQANPASASSQFRNSGVKSGVSLRDRAVIELAYKSNVLRMSLDKPK